MKSVLLIRHTKSDWSSTDDDYDRAIREDRKDDAKSIAREVAKRGYKPDYIAASPAKRTMQTAKIICSEWDYKYADIMQEKTLYETSAYEIVMHVRGINEQYKNAVIICHNPSITNFINRYSDTFIDNVPTTGAALIRFDTNDWQSIGDRGKLEWFLKPKELRK